MFSTFSYLSSVSITIAYTLFIANLSALLCARVEANTLRFRDVSVSAGIRQTQIRRRKYGGPAVADLDGDGWPDLILGHHDNKKVEVYFNRRDGTFTKNKWEFWTDTHGLNPFRLNPRDKPMHFTLSQGGSNGKMRVRTMMFSVGVDRTITVIEDGLGINQAIGRGRTVVALNLDTVGNEGNGIPDFIIMNAGDTNRGNPIPNHYGFRGYFRGPGREPRLRLRSLAGKSEPAFDSNWFGTVADVDESPFGGQVEFFTFQDLTVYRVVNSFRLQDITRVVLPDMDFKGTVAMAEFDYDNDGRFDIYVARTRSGDLRWLRPNIGFRDYLLRNVGGRYVDVTKRAGIPDFEDSRGVTTGDFNNDGYVDILVIRWMGPDMLLLNNGNGTFRAIDAGFNRGSKIRGDMAQAVDYDRDGRLDVILSEGHTHNQGQGGYYRIMKNIMPRPSSQHGHILVRVGSSPSYGATSLHAVVTVFAFGVKKMVRRVGTQGAAVSNSYIELLHFGIASRRKVRQVTVRWSDGTTDTRLNVLAGALVKFGNV